MSKSIFGASIIALLFSSICLANVQETSEEKGIATAEMKSLILLCDGHEGEGNSAPEEN